MKHQLLYLFASAVLVTGILSSCHGKLTINTDHGSDTLEFNTDSIQSLNINMETNAINAEDGEADDSEMLGLAPYAETEMDLSELPKTAVMQERLSNFVLYVNEETKPNEDETAGCYTVWLADERSDKLFRVLLTNPTAAAPWEELQQKKGGVEVPMHLIGTASSAKFASKDGSKIVVEGCPDARNIWTYIIDLEKHTAIQLPSTEGVQEIDVNKGEIIVASYGYYPAPDYGRYTYNEAYSLNGKFLRQTSEKIPE